MKASKNYPGKKLYEAKKYLTRLTIFSLLDAGFSLDTIAFYADCHFRTVQRWKAKDDIFDLSRSGRPLIYKEDRQLKLIAFYCQTQPFAGYGRWSVRLASDSLANNPEQIGFLASKSTIQRILKKHNLKPHKSKYFLHISDPYFFPKMNHIIDLYMKRPKNLFCFDESPGIQILQRLVPDMQTEKTKTRLEEFEYIRNGTTDLFACFEVNTGKVFSECKSCHDTDMLVDFMGKHFISIQENEPIHYILDNLNTHCNYKVCALVAEHSKIECPPEEMLNTMEKRRNWLSEDNKRIVFHFTPFHGSWLNQVEIWFGIMAQKCLKESFSSPQEIHTAISAFVDTWNTLLAHPFKWEYTADDLQEKVINSFIQNLKGGQILKIELRVLTNLFNLIRNLFNDTQNDISEKVWNELRDTLKLKHFDLNTRIRKEPGPKRKKNAQVALKNLLFALVEEDQITQKCVA